MSQETMDDRFYRAKRDETPSNYRPRTFPTKYSVMSNLKAQLEWVKRQLEYITISESYRSYFRLNRGEVFEFDWGVNVNAEFSYRHYGVVIRDSSENNPLVMVCPLKSSRIGEGFPGDVNLGVIPELVTERESIAVINQIRSLDKLRLNINPIINDTMTARAILKLSNEQIQMLMDGIQRMFVIEKCLNENS